MKKLTLALFALTYLATLVVYAPASLFSVALGQLSSGKITLADAKGTLWSGNATPLIQMPQADSIALHSLSWRVAPLSIFGGKLRAQLQWEEGSTPIVASVGVQQLELQHLSATLPAELLGGFAPLLRPAQLHGMLQLHSEQMTFAAQQITGNAAIDWVDASSTFSSIAPLGNYRIHLAGTGQRLDANLSTLSGALLLTGQGSWTAAQGLHFQGTASASADQTDALAALLNHLGPQVSSGVHSITLSAH